MHWFSKLESLTSLLDSVLDKWSGAELNKSREKPTLFQWINYEARLGKVHGPPVAGDQIE